VDKRFQQIQVE